MSRICLVSHPRSGSTSLLRTLAKKAEVSTAYEMFHMNEEVVLEHLKHALSDENIEAIKGKSLELGFDSLKDFYQTDSLKYLDLVHSLAEGEDFIFKIFPYHIKSEENIKKVINSCDSVIFLSRNSLHSCISNQIAQKVGTYANVDTSSVEVEFSEEEYKKWHNHIVQFFVEVDELLDKPKVSKLNLTYERFFLKNDLENQAECLLASLGIVKREKDFFVQALKKQDFRLLASEKVVNPSRLKNYLTKLGISDLDDVSVSSPDYLL